MLNKNYVFFRDDDVYRLNERFLNVFNLFMKNKIPVVYAIIPGKLKNSLTELINKAKDKHPSLLDIAQHGWMHKNYNSADLNKKYEFGPKRSYGSQKKDIISGWLRLFQCFRDKLAPVFIPPYHGYDSSTLRIINELTQRNNFQIFSAGQKIAYTPRRFLDIPAQVSISSLQLRDKKRYRLLLKRLLKELRRVSLVGILLHHEAYNKKELGILQKLITDIKKNNANFLLLSDLSRQKSNLKLDITLEITNRCNLKCKHCNIWRETPKRDLTARDINRLINALSKHYFIGSVSLTGGEPFLNSEFNKIYGVLSKFRNNKTIESIGIYSNGYLLKSILGFLEANQDSLNGLDFGLSLDGLGKTHNILRGRPDSFRKVMSLFLRIKGGYPQVNLAAKFTINRLNLKDLPKIYRFCRRHNINLMPKLLESNCIYYYHKENTGPDSGILLSKKDKILLRKILSHIQKAESNSKQKTVNTEVINLFMAWLKNNASLNKECYTPLYSLFISHKGEIHPCLYLPAITNMRRKGWLDKILSGKHLEYAHKGINGSCPKCMAYHGLLRGINI